MMCGGLHQAKKADAEIQQYVDSVRGEVESKSGKSFSEFTAVSYKSQVVAGTNYFVKVNTGDDEFVHVRIFKQLPHSGGGLELAAFQLGKTSGDTIEHFEPARD